MKVSLYTVCRGRLDHLRKTLPHNEASGAELVVVGSGPGLREFMNGRPSRFIEDAGPWNVNRLRNRALEQTTGDIVINTDADNYVGPLSIEHAEETFTNWLPGIKHMIRGRNSRGQHGRIGFHRAALLALGGWSEEHGTPDHMARGADITTTIRAAKRQGFTWTRWPKGEIRHIDHPQGETHGGP